MSSRNVNAFEGAASRNFEEALAVGFPAFLTSIAESNPVNATPYLARYDEFLHLAADWPGRSHLLAALEYVRTSARQSGVTVDAMLIGGSFHDLVNPAPQDVDCIMFYRRDKKDEPVDGIGLVDLRKQAKLEAVDVRFVPIHADPIALIKSLCYFTTLYCQTKPAREGRVGGEPRGLLLLDCRT